MLQIMHQTTKVNIDEVEIQENNTTMQEVEDFNAIDVIIKK